MKNINYLVKKIITNPKYLLYYLDKINILRMDDREYLKMLYRDFLKKDLDLENPTTFNEKLQWLKLYDRKDIYTSMVDKSSVKDIVANKIGIEYIIPTIGVFDKWEDINFDLLPEKFVIKCTHDSGGVVICKNKNTFNYKDAKKKIKKSLRQNYFYLFREWPYKNIKPRIIIEKFIEDNANEDLFDYKFMCFNGKVKCSFVCSNRKSKNGLNVDFYNRSWEKMPFERHYKNSNYILSKPKNYELMIELAEKLSDNIPFVRVDFYNINGNILFGELTFFPGSGLEEFNPEKYDKIIGDYLELPRR